MSMCLDVCISSENVLEIFDKLLKVHENYDWLFYEGRHSPSAIPPKKENP